MVSRVLIERLKLSSRRQYQIAWEAGMHPSTLSKLINGICRVKPSDPRIIRLGMVLGLNPGECFQEEAER